METATQEPSAMDSLVKGLSDQQGFSQYKDDRESPSDAPSSEDTLNKSDNTESRINSEGTEKTESSLPETKNKQEDVTQKEGVATNRTDTTEQSKPRAPARIQELLETVKQKDARIAELEKVQPKTATEAQQTTQQIQPEPKPIIPKPEFETEYLKEQLGVFQSDEVEALLAGDKEAILAARKKIAAVQGLIKKNESWDADNAQAIKDRQALASQYNQRALEKYPALKDQTSEHWKAYQGVRADVAKHVPEFLDKPMAEAWLAQISDWKLSASKASTRLAAADSELKKLREENQKLIKAGQPLTTTGKVDVSSKADDTGDAKKSLLSGIKDFNRQRSYTS